ncbi:histidine phosphatase family protein [Paenibacillus sanguinis]|uniref:histidine phosphatase family protein n=1 Tax=Paenibacillus sanguinis TaxID=225906 RepID=UPI0003720506|nr:histidine phosphatase family protein [Paenibacillus sanguinis]
MAATVEWWLVRHGVTAWNHERRYQGHSDIPLLAGAEAGLEGLERELDGVDFEAVYVSDLRRCRETLATARPDLIEIMQPDPRLRELNFGHWEGCTYEQLKDNETYRAWIDQPQAVTPPEGESWQEFEMRVTDLYAELLTISETLVRERRETVKPALLLHSPLHLPSDSLSLCSSKPVHGFDKPPTTTGADSQEPAGNSPARLLIITHGGVIAKLCSLVQPELDFWDTRVAPGGLRRLSLAL